MLLEVNINITRHMHQYSPHGTQQSASASQSFVTESSSLEMSIILD